jgi:hypothetical protein
MLKENTRRRIASIVFARRFPFLFETRKMLKKNPWTIPAPINIERISVVDFIFF